MTRRHRWNHRTKVSPDSFPPKYAQSFPSQHHTYLGWILLVRIVLVLPAQRRKSLLGLIVSHSLSLSVLAMEQMSLLRTHVTRFVPQTPPARDVWGASVTGRSAQASCLFQIP